MSVKNKLFKSILFAFVLISTFLSSFTSSAQSRSCSQYQFEKASFRSPEAMKKQQEKILSIYSKTEDSQETIIMPVAIHFQGVNAKRECLERLTNESLKSLNDDFAGVGKNFEEWEKVKKNFPDVQIGNANINFVLANRNHPKEWGLKDGQKAITVNVYEDVNTLPIQGYFHIFVKDIKEKFGGKNTLGYAPIGFDGNGTGVVLNKFAMGGNGWCGSAAGSVSSNDNFDLGRTLTHEAGHAFLLFHTWGNQNSCDSDDNIQDTPLQEQPNFSCKRTLNSSCGSLDMCMNFMDYATDSEMYMFTAGQTQIMRRYAKTLENVASVAKSAIGQIGVLSVDSDTMKEDTVKAEVEAEIEAETVQEEETEIYTEGEQEIEESDGVVKEENRGWLLIVIIFLLGLLGYKYVKNEDGSYTVKAKEKERDS